MSGIVLNKVQQKGLAHFLKRKEGEIRISNDGKAVKIYFKPSTVTINEDGSWVEMLNAVTIPSSEIGKGVFS